MMTKKSLQKYSTFSPLIGGLFTSSSTVLMAVFLGLLNACASAQEQTETIKLAAIGDNNAAFSLDAAVNDTTKVNAVSATPENHSDQAANEAEVTRTIKHRYQYKVRGRQYKVFADANNFQEIGLASWYGPGFHGKKTANGEIYNMYALTAAHKTLPLGCKVLVTNLQNKRQVVVRINDRGPFHGGRVIDLSKKAAQQLGIIRHGFAKVHLKIADNPTK